ncbi:hypothetical protein DGG96_09480 [Legionella qingyii]|uniref:Uncharacterized protein n=1 Tax=Legionella qingyii TaxID=2184757 RepID=A0A317U3Y3_9GAMM|nr:hypothetical protein DGG96_09480 [Legionella qingyii]
MLYVTTEVERKKDTEIDSVIRNYLVGSTLVKILNGVPRTKTVFKETLADVPVFFIDDAYCFVIVI